MDEINRIRLIIESIKERLPDDCAYLLDQIFKEILKDMKKYGIEITVKKWYGEVIDESEIEVI
ncbi:MAG: hypothetical protein QXV69_05025 [Sulfolobaceae archaeon]